MINRRSKLSTAAAFVCLTMWFAVYLHAAVSAQTEDVRELTPDQTIERELAGGQSHKYKFEAKTNELLQIKVEQRGIDVVVRLFDAGGKQFAEMDSPNGTQGFENITFIISKTGSYTIEVASLEANAAGGKYTIFQDISRTATEKDKKLLQAQAIYDEAVGLYNQNTTKALQAALPKFQEASRLFTEIDDKSEKMGKCLYYLGEITEKLGKDSDALKFYEQALIFFQANDNKSWEAQMLNTIGVMYSRIGENRKALEYYSQALPLFKSVGNKRSEAATLNNIGNIYYFLGEREKALEYYAQALPLRKAGGDKKGEADTLNTIGVVYDSLGEKQKSLDYHERALLLFKEIGSKDGEASMLNNIGFVYKGLGENQKALDYYGRALLLFKEIGSKYGEIVMLNNIGGAYYDLGEKQKALDYYNQALTLVRAVGRKEVELSTLSLIGKFYLDLGEKQKALDYYNQALLISRAGGYKASEAKALTTAMIIWASLKNPRLAVFYGKQSVNLYQEMRANIGGLSKSTQKTYLNSIEKTYRGLADILIANGRIAEAEQVLGMLKEEEYLSYLRRDDIVAADLKGRISLSADEKKAFEDYEKFAGEITLTAKDFGELEKKKNDLPLGESLTAEDQKQYDDLKAKYDAAVTVFNKYLDDLKIKFSENDKRVASVESDTQGLLKKLNQPRTVIISTIVGEDRLNLILTTSDDEFTLQSFQNNLGKTAIVHIASHFSLNAGDETDSYLLLGGGEQRKFSLDALKKTRLDNIELLTLSACNTAMTSGANSSGVEIEGFGALAQKQGAKTVLATLWAVADDSTGDLMSGFYKNLEPSTKLGKAEALRKAQIALLKGRSADKISKGKRSEVFKTGDENKNTQPKFTADKNAPYAHPFYWSPFVLIGNWR